MGKRKYKDDEESIKRLKKSSDTEDENQPPQPQPEQNYLKLQPNFDIKHFRKELAEKQGQTMALTQFLQVCLNPDSDMDYLAEYLRVGGNSHEILRQISSENKKNLSLATPTFHIFHLLILKVQSSMPHMITITEEACRYFLNTFIPTVEIMISENSGPRHRKIILNLLTSMVTLSSDLGVEVLNQVPLTPKHLQYIVEKPNYKEKDNVRTAFVHFMTSFLVDCHLPLIKALLEKQGLLPLVIPGLIQDESDAVLMFLSILKKNVIDNPLISKTLKLKTFSHQVLHNLFKMFNWKGPPELSVEAKNEVKPEIMVLLSNIITTLFTSHKLGLYFMDTYVGTSDTNKNQNLYKAMLSLKRPWENSYECDTVLEIIYKCPDLHRAIIHVIEQSFEPQHSPIWDRATEFTIKLLDKLKPEDMLPRLYNLNTMQTVNFIRFITLPVPLLKFIQANFGKDHTISLYCIKVLVKMLHLLKRYMKILNLREAQDILVEMRSKLEYFIPKHVPVPSTIISLINDIISGKEGAESSQDYKLPKVDTSDSLLGLIDTLLLYNYVHSSFFESLESSIDMKTILDFTKTLQGGQVPLLKFKVVSLWLTLDQSALSLKNPMFKDLFLIMLEVFTSEERNIWIEAKDTLQEFLKQTEIYESDEDEIQLFLYSLRKSKVEPISLVADIVEYVMQNKKDLIEYMRNQMSNFEIADEDTASNLDKLFTDLMNNRNTEDSMFLENKMPSPFIIGCIQFIQGNKEAKKSLKSFLSLYIANLMHCNCSPELSEVLIGDSKLEVRSYVTACMLNLIELPDSIVKDDTLLKLSDSIVNDDPVDFKSILQFIEDGSEDNYDLIISDKYYKILPQHSIDESELFMWAKYLMFCIVRLSKADRLTGVNMQKITNYFQIIIATGRQQHLLITCRRILLNLFKNAHFLRMFKAVDMTKKSYILTTEFMLQMIVQNKDIISYLDKNHYILKSYQQKTYTEIIKAFVKINKRKNIKSDHTIRVLEVVGFSKENDNHIFEKIFEADLESCFNDDKEPTLVVEVLRVLINKYSLRISLELNPELVVKTITLYGNLITNKALAANASKLETALATYFENKPHHATLITDEVFKKFFNAFTIRKTTANLAAIILRLNGKLHKVFSDELNREEILNQRELTLPLANEVLSHHQFLTEYPDCLVKLYNEYKTNINKYLEKPHKAGQIYMQNWKLLRKLVTECMMKEDCQKLFSKINKFELLDANHVQIVQTALLKLYIIDGEEKHEYFCNYVLSMLHVMVTCFKDEKLENLDTVVSLVYSTTQISNIKISENKEDLKKIVDSAIWKNFCKSVLKNSLKVKTADQANVLGPKLLCLLTTLIKMLYPPDHTEIVDIFDMLTSHSEFLNVMLSHHSLDIKSRLLQLIFCLITSNKTIMKPQQIPVFLSAYHGTKNPCDRLILCILEFYENNGLPVNEYKPYVWGDSAANYYAVRKKRTASLWSHPTPNQVLNLLDREIIERTIRNFPVNQKLDYYYELPDNCETIKRTSSKAFIEYDRKQKMKMNNKTQDNEAVLEVALRKEEYNKVLQKFKEKDALTTSQQDDDDEIYDPAFLFPLLSHLLAPGSMASCFKVMRTGLLSVTLMALSSSCPLMRAAAYHVLHRFCMLLELETRHKNDKLLLTDFITTLRQSIASALKDSPKEDKIVGDFKNPRLPSVGALYLARALTVCTAPSEPLYRPVNNFLIAKQHVDLTIVPDFLSLFHDNEIECTERRLWILSVMSHGIKTMKDVIVIFKSMCIKMLMDFYTTVLCDKRTKARIISVFGSIASIPRALEILIEGHGLLTWLHSIIWYLRRDDKIVVREILNILNAIIVSVNVNAFGKQIKLNLGDVKVKGDEEYELLTIVYDLLNYVDQSDVDEVTTYLKLYNAISKRTVKFLTKRQITNIFNRCGRRFKDEECVKVIMQGVRAENSQMLRSKIIENSNCLVRELHLLSVSYIA
ncbi:uncharacterized protein LOC123712803 [Pieris brassicae]|uniref:uncharacterized protein LOC123712803 n=1 Tax=Pieris brassicae TaxID=7116 RepID=UPI001E661223|nr:uncharacterized protein LOC123712803 [Pieris brassicae]